MRRILLACAIIAGCAVVGSTPAEAAIYCRGYVTSTYATNQCREDLGAGSHMRYKTRVYCKRTIGVTTYYTYRDGTVRSSTNANWGPYSTAYCPLYYTRYNSTVIKWYV